MQSEAAESISDGDGWDGLNGTETTIVEALSKHGITDPNNRMIGEKIARLARVTFNTNVRNALKSLREKRIIDNPGRGYYLTAKGRMLCKPRKKS